MELKVELIVSSWAGLPVCNEHLDSRRGPACIIPETLGQSPTF